MLLRFLKTNFFIPFLFFSLMSFSGCVYLVIGSFAALGGYVISPDTVEGIVSNKDQNEVWDSAIQIASVMGVIQEQNDAAGILIAKVQGTKVTITVIPMGSTSIKLTVKARKAFLPKIRVAQDMYIKIVSRLNE